MTLNEFRSRFPIFKRRVYVNSCSQGALSTDVDEAMRAYLDSWHECGSPWEMWVEQVERLRARFASSIGAGVDEIAVMPSASAGINAVASALSFAGPRSHVVIGDLGEGWDFRTLNRAFRLLHSNPEASLIALGTTRFWQAPEGLRLDAGPFVAALEYATGRKPVVCGKPAEPFFQAAAAKLGFAPSEILMIGDDIDIDVGGAQRAGLRGALVRTGKFRPGDLNHAVKPDAVLDSIANLPDWWDR